MSEPLWSVLVMWSVWFAGLLVGSAGDRVEVRLENIWFV